MKEGPAAPRASLHIPSLDGIRAVSFLIVFFAHAGLGSTLVPGGFGVTVFFLLSGFLITTLLRMEYEQNKRISLRNFYLRRVLRILPPLYVSLALAFVVYSFRQGHPTAPIGGTLAQIFQVANYFQIYADPAEVLPGTGVLWSLAVEEHFYLLFPLLYVWMAPRLPVSRQALIMVALCVAALVWRCVLRFHFHVHENRTYYATDTRFDSIVLGCLFAIVANPVLKDSLHETMLRQMRWLLPACLMALLGTFLYRDEDFRESFRYTIQGLALIPIFMAAIHYQKSILVMILNLRFVRFLGVLSYSLYLCHGIILESVRSAWETSALLTGAVSLALAICFAAVVHYLVERPCARVRARLSKLIAK